MITRADIRQETNSTTYSRGQQVWLNGKVHNLKVQEEKDGTDSVTKISASVEGSSGEEYQVEITLVLH